MGTFRHVASTKQFSREWMVSELFPQCEELRASTTNGHQLAGKSLYCLFYEPSFLTRTSFQRAIELLGGVSYQTEDASQFFPIRTTGNIGNIIGNLASMRIDVVVLRSSDPGVMDRAVEADSLPVVNGGSLDDHPTQALADLVTVQNDLKRIDGLHIAFVGRLEHRNVNAFLMGLAQFEDVKATLIPFSGQADPDVVSYCEDKGMELSTADDMAALAEVDAIYLNGPRTVAHAQLMKDRGRLNLRIDDEFMSTLQPHCVILDPMQLSGDFAVEVEDERLAFYRQTENALFVRMAVLSQMLG